MGRPRGSRVFLIDTAQSDGTLTKERVFARPVMVDGKIRWHAKGGVDITNQIQDQLPEEPQEGGQGPPADAQESPRAAPPAAPAGQGQGQVPDITQAAQGAQEVGSEGEPEEEPEPTLTEALQGQLREINSAAQVAKETLKGIEVQLTAIKRKLNEPDIQHRIAVEAERKRLGFTGRRPMVTTERLATRKETGG